jgi:hypothetical protein
MVDVVNGNQVHLMVYFHHAHDNQTNEMCGKVPTQANSNVPHIRYYHNVICSFTSIA